VLGGGRKRGGEGKKAMLAAYSLSVFFVSPSLVVVRGEKRGKRELGEKKKGERSS